MISTPVHCDHCEMCRSEICLTLLRFVHQLCHNNFASLRAGDDGRIGDNICIAFTDMRIQAWFDTSSVQVIKRKRSLPVRFKGSLHET